MSDPVAAVSHELPQIAVNNASFKSLNGSSISNESSVSSKSSLSDTSPLVAKKQVAAGSKKPSKMKNAKKESAQTAIKPVGSSKPFQEQNVDIQLSNRSLWESFNSHTTEMIITKQGR